MERGNINLCLESMTNKNREKKQIEKLEKIKLKKNQRGCLHLNNL